MLYVFLVRENDEIPGLRVMEGKRDFLERKRGGHPRLFSGVLWVALLFSYITGEEEKKKRRDHIYISDHPLIRLFFSFSYIIKNIF